MSWEEEFECQITKRNLKYRREPGEDRDSSWPAILMIVVIFCFFGRLILIKEGIL